MVGSSAPIPRRVAAVREAAMRVSGVERLDLTGSRAAGTATAMSDWDFELELTDHDDFPRVAEELGRAMASVEHHAVFWDPLSDRANLIVLVPGPVKVDLIVPDQPNPARITRWQVTAESLPHIDDHFWDWILWLGSKEARGSHGLVEAELQTMAGALLEPLGIADTPESVAEAVRAYLPARAGHARTFGVAVDDRLGREVRAALHLS